MVLLDAHAMWFLPSAMNVKVKKFNQVQVNGKSYYDSLKIKSSFKKKNKYGRTWKDQWKGQRRRDRNGY